MGVIRYKMKYKIGDRIVGKRDCVGDICEKIFTIRKIVHSSRYNCTNYLMEEDYVWWSELWIERKVIEKEFYPI